MKHPMTFIAPIIALVLIWLSAHPFPKAKETENFAELAKLYVQGYEQADIAPLNLSWQANLQAQTIRAAKHDEQLAFFTNMKARLGAVATKNLDFCQGVHHKILSYETDLNLKRLPLATVPIDASAGTSPGLSSLAGGREWYVWYLHKWLTVDTSPEDIMAFGEQEISLALNELTTLEQEIIESEQAQNLADFVATQSAHYTDLQEALDVFARRKQTVKANLSKLFKVYEIDAVEIKEGTDTNFGRAPGYYSPPVFYFNWVSASFPKNDTDFLYLHEAVPGHHMQIEIAQKHLACKLDIPPVFYSAYSEGWAAYTETLGEQLGLYTNFETRLGAIDWNLIRSTRVYLDVAINYHAWTDDQALAYWQNTLPNHLHALAKREINRMRDWPAQVITYKIGADAILKLKTSEQKRLGTDFDIIAFHDKVLRMGPVPLSILAQTYALFP